MNLVEMINVGKRFEGLMAVNALNLEVRDGEILGLIGPNGAGKTTVFNLMTGFLPADSGTILFKERNVGGLKPHEIFELGVSRTFQVVKPFAGLTVLENVMVGAFSRTKKASESRKMAIEVINYLEITHLLNRKASSLTISDRKYLEIARTLATTPKLLLLDEPMGGLNSTEVDHMMGQISKIRDRGTTIFIIEHVMKAVMAISDRIIVLHHGEKIAEGIPSQISTNQEVITAYLGDRYDVS